MRSYGFESIASFTCRIQTTGTATLELQFAQADRAGGVPPTVSVYLDGNERKRVAAQTGQLRTILMDVTRARSIAIQVQCPRAQGCGNYVYFTKAHLRGVVAPGRR